MYADLYIILLLLTLLNSAQTWFQKDLESVLTHKEKSCVFPTVHQRKAMYECQYSSISAPTELFHSSVSVKPVWWCALTDNFDHYPEWRVCPETASTYAGNKPGHRCHFPFIYKNKLQTTCVRGGGKLHFADSEDTVPTDDGRSGYWWCATTGNFDRDGQWTKCRPQHAQQLPCHFSQRTHTAGGLVRGIQHECQPFVGHWVCRTELDQLRECPKRPFAQSDLKPDTEGGNDPGFPCHLPFQASLPMLSPGDQWIGQPRRRNVTECLPGTAQTTNRPESIYPPWIGYWCSTTADFDEHRLWTRCTIKPDRADAVNDRFRMNGIINLAELWSYLAWLSVFSGEERSKMHSPGQVYSQEFQQSLAEVERQRIKWEVGIGENQIDDEVQWWTWLAPFWWMSYKSNQTNWPISTTSSHTEDEENSEENPLSQGFQLPRWVEAWTSAGWSKFGQSMGKRWNRIKTLVRVGWNRSWSVAFALGFTTAVGVGLIAVGLFFICIDTHKRKQLVRLLDCKSDKKRGQIFIPEDSLLSIANCDPIYTPLNDHPPTYPSCTLPVFTQDVCPANGECQTDNSKIAVRSNSVPLPIQRHARSKFDGIEILDHTEVFFKTASSCQPFARTPCWPNPELNCACYQRQLRRVLEVLLSTIRKSEVREELRESVYNLQYLTHSLLDRRATLNPGCGCLSTLRESNRAISMAYPTQSVESDLINDPVQPTAPPPSYEQLSNFD
ncbi:hypothetical protein P879_05534 [Paragonimus westermani]|uniref:Fibronectin type-II domain-containing protein n=1 Tax=Paragonimus westermani TaxID=34504 RepID=A0A8T0DS53_9TREM|nr:hypothetical protein P879_05534 [Paragonimus westermani]